jgi:hypothetical protein
MNEEFLYPRQTGEAALQAGILREIDPQRKFFFLVENIRLIYGARWSEDRCAMIYSAESGISIQTLGVDELKEQVRDTDLLHEPVPFSDVRVLEYSGDQVTGFAKMENWFKRGSMNPGLFGCHSR